MDTKTGGILYLCPTPIGNLQDITKRTIEVLKSVDLIEAEDTRNTIRLLNYYGIHTGLTSYHENNKYDKAEELTDYMLLGKKLACVTDAGTPGISDPGEILVKKAVEKGIEVVSLPGATAFVTALTASGFPSRRFVFEGFLPKDNKERHSILDIIRNEPRTIILYEAPHRIRKTLSELKTVLGDKRKIALCRELTKIHEEIIRLTLEEAELLYEDTEPRGEYVIIIEGKPADETEYERKKAFEGLSIPEHVALYEGEGFDRKTSMKKTAYDRGVTKRDIYKALLKQTEHRLDK